MSTTLRHNHVLTFAILLLIFLNYGIAKLSNSLQNKDKIFASERMLDMDLSCDNSSLCTAEIPIDQVVLIDLGPHARFMFIADCGTADKELFMKVQSDNLLSVLAYLKTDNLTQPTYLNNPQETQRSGAWSSELSISKESLKSAGPDPRLVIELTNPLVENQTVKLSFNYKETPTLAIILGTIGGILVVCIFVYCITKRVRRRLAARRAERRHAFERPLSSRNHPSNLMGRQNLQITDLDNYYPEIKFEGLNSLFKQTSCSICLEELTEGAIIRRLSCGHIFHSECIKQWLSNQLLKNQAWCPNCHVDVFACQNSEQSILNVVRTNEEIA